MAELMGIIIPGSLAFIMFGMGMGLKVADFTRLAQFPKAFAIGLTAQILLLPIIAGPRLGSSWRQLMGTLARPLLLALLPALPAQPENSGFMAATCRAEARGKEFAWGRRNWRASRWISRLRKIKPHNSDRDLFMPLLSPA